MFYCVFGHITGEKKWETFLGRCLRLPLFIFMSMGLCCAARKFLRTKFHHRKFGRRESRRKENLLYGYPALGKFCCKKKSVVRNFSPHGNFIVRVT